MKPDSSRESSVEHFLVGLNYHGGEENMEKIELSTFGTQHEQHYPEGSKELEVFKFVTCGDLSGFDSQRKIEEEQSH